MPHLYAVPDNTTVSDFALLRPQAFTWTELTTMFGAAAVKHAHSVGRLKRVLPGVYAHSEHAGTWAVRAHAALLWEPRAALAGASALFVWDIIDKEPRQLELIHVHPHHPKTPSWIRLRRVTYDYETREVGALRVVTPAFAVGQAYGYLPLGTRADVVFGAVRRRIVAPGQVADAVRAMPRVKARASLLARLEAAAQGAESYLEEEALRNVLVGPGFEGLQRQVDVVVQGRAYRLDTYDPATRTIIELDGAGNHSKPEDRERDIERDLLLATLGRLTIRLSYANVISRPEWCREVVLSTMRSRAAKATQPL